MIGEFFFGGRWLCLWKRYREWEIVVEIAHVFIEICVDVFLCVCGTMLKWLYAYKYLWKVYRMCEICLKFFFNLKISSLCEQQKVCFYIWSFTTIPLFLTLSICAYVCAWEKLTGSEKHMYYKELQHCDVAIILL